MTQQVHITHFGFLFLTLTISVGRTYKKQKAFDRDDRERKGNREKDWLKERNRKRDRQTERKSE